MVELGGLAMIDATNERDKARTERDRARNTLAKIRGIIVANRKGIGSYESAIASIASILHVGPDNRRSGVRPARRTTP